MGRKIAVRGDVERQEIVLVGRISGDRRNPYVTGARRHILIST